MKAATFQRLLEQWRDDGEDGVVAGREIFEFIDSDRRPSWAANILEWVCSLSGVDVPELRTITEMARTPPRWKEAHAGFYEIRSLYSSENPALLAAVLNIGETTGKVTYNASGEPAPFDYHAGWRMAPCLRRFLAVCDEASEDEAWDLLVAPLRRGDRSQ